ncbi:helix-turn-helix domain-containing protein [Paenibacillus allorhizosphaerae]|uniref:HTH araC/xylS-type domain-containing protein n=1 Tax=Paenibacillus allorhizosphaerae TaxID=2849866 RepID=A0ABN7TSM4_9BACL|nr:hypothetical protein PAECIP111802_05718 [Paenibacillus allorhizosphaerae]
MGFLIIFRAIEPQKFIPDYLSEYRMKMAKKWLVETDMKIAEIVEKLKYNTPANFIRYFASWKAVPRPVPGKLF